VRLQVTVPVLNEVAILATSIGALRRFLSDRLSFVEWEIVIADNGSNDGTGSVAAQLAAAEPGVRVVRLDARGRGRALKHVWLSGDADVYAYMDADLSAGLDAFPVLVDLVASGRCDVAYGSRLEADSRTARGHGREFLSRVYNRIQRASTGARISDAQCGFKAVSRRVVADVVPHVENNQWFFDTELLVLAERRGYRTTAVPLTWRERTPSRVRIIGTILEDLAGLWRLWWTR
jgi:glycosyltransferase involved in cell wall biosynthesis